MPKYIVEREIPGSGALTTQTLQKLAKRSVDALNKMNMGTRIQWISSFVAADKWYCVYIAEDEQLIREHAKIGGFPILVINEVISMVDPISAEGLFANS